MLSGTKDEVVPKEHMRRLWEIVAKRGEKKKLNGSEYKTGLERAKYIEFENGHHSTLNCFLFSFLFYVLTSCLIYQTTLVRSPDIGQPSPSLLSVLSVPRRRNRNRFRVGTAVARSSGCLFFRAFKLHIFFCITFRGDKAPFSMELACIFIRISMYYILSSRLQGSFMVEFIYFITLQRFRKDFFQSIVKLLGGIISWSVIFRRTLPARSTISRMAVCLRVSSSPVLSLHKNRKISLPPLRFTALH